MKRIKETIHPIAILVIVIGLLISCSKENMPTPDAMSNITEKSANSTQFASWQGINVNDFKPHFKVYRPTLYDGYLEQSASPYLTILTETGGDIGIDGWDYPCYLNESPIFHMEKSTGTPIDWHYVHPYKLNLTSGQLQQVICPSKTVLKVAPKPGPIMGTTPVWSNAHPNNPQTAFFHFNYWTCEWKFADNATDYFWYTTPSGLPGNDSGC